jgi:hypothetical protein
MSVPSQVAAQAEAARKIQEDLGKPPADPNNPPENEASSPESTTAPVPSPPPADDWQHKYRTLQGMFNAQIGKLQRELNDLRAENAAIKAAPPPSAAPVTTPAPAQAIQDKYVTDKDEQEFGADTIDLIRRAAREEFAGQLSAERDRVAKLEAALATMQTDIVPKLDKVAETTKVNAEQTFWSTLQARVPDWRAINDSQDFHTWLLAEDPITGNTPQSYLEAAQAAGNVERVVAVFDTWKGMQTSAPTPPPKPSPAVSELEKQIAPGRGRGADPTPEEKKTYTREEVAQFYRDVTMGKYVGREQEKTQLERAIFSASQEGRVT